MTESLESFLEETSYLLSEFPYEGLTQDALQNTHWDKWYLRFGYYAETDIVGLGHLPDDRWLTVEAWCDTTGWDCQAGCDWYIAETREAAIYGGLTDSGRLIIGLPPRQERDDR